MFFLPLKGIPYEFSTLVSGQDVNESGRKEPCADLDLNAAECLEAYGTHKGLYECRKYLEDSNECHNGVIRLYRRFIMREQRMRKIVSGEWPAEKKYGTPYAYDAFIIGTYYP